MEGTALYYKGVLFAVLLASCRTRVPPVCAEIKVEGSQATLPRAQTNLEHICSQGALPPYCEVAYFKC